MRRRATPAAVGAGAVWLALAAGCADERIDRAETIRARACACSTAACVEAEIASFADLDAQAMPSRYRPRLEALAQEIVGCMDRVIGGEAQTGGASPSAVGSGSAVAP